MRPRHKAAEYRSRIGHLGARNTAFVQPLESTGDTSWIASAAWVWMIDVPVVGP